MNDISSDKEQHLFKELLTICFKDTDGLSTLIEEAIVVDGRGHESSPSPTRQTILLSENTPSSSTLQETDQAESLMIVEPTPLGTQGINLVDNVDSSVSFSDSSFATCFRTLFDENDERSHNITQEELRHLQPPTAAVSSSESVVGALTPFDVQVVSEPEDTLSSSSSSSVTVASEEEEVQEEILTAAATFKVATAFRSNQLEQWNQRYQELVVFKQEYGHCLVPLQYSPNPSLAHWVKRQRHQYRMKYREGKHSTLTRDRQTALEALGFVWDSHAAVWEERLGELRKFKDQHGHCRVPKKYTPNQQLAVWVKCQRRQYKLLSEKKDSNMNLERIQKLCEVGFDFAPRSSSRQRCTAMSSAAIAQYRHSMSI